MVVLRKKFYAVTLRRSCHNRPQAIWKEGALRDITTPHGRGFTHTLSMSLEMEEFGEKERVKRDLELARERQEALAKLPADVRQRLLSATEEEGNEAASGLDSLKRAAGRAGIGGSDLED